MYRGTKFGFNLFFLDCHLPGYKEPSFMGWSGEDKRGGRGGGGGVFLSFFIKIIFL